MGTGRWKQKETRWGRVTASQEEGEGVTELCAAGIVC